MVLNYAMKNLALLLLLCLVSVKSYSQNEPSIESPKNVIHGSLGSFVFVNSVHLTYDRLLAQKESDFFKSYYLTFKGGGHVALDFSGNNGGSGYLMSAGVTGLTGKRKNHFEIGLGLGYFIEDGSLEGGNENNIYPSVSIGYRKQTSKGFMFRTGVGIAEWAYVGFGYSF